MQGARAAFDAVKPLLAKKDPSLATGIDTQFAAVETALAPYKPGGTFVLYTALTAADTKALAPSIDVLAEPLSKVGKKVVSA